MGLLLDFVLNQAVIFIFVPLVLSIALYFSRPTGPNRFGALPPVLRLRPAVVTVLRRTFDGRGRAGRSEFWWGMAVAAVFALVPLAAAWRFSLYLALGGLIPFIPLVSAGVRRLHDIGRSGWWLFIALTGLGLISVIILWCVPSQTPDDREAADLF